jgi:hypothetical protein
MGTKRLSLVVAFGLLAAASRTMVCNRSKKISASIVAVPRLGVCNGLQRTSLGRDAL